MAINYDDDDLAELRDLLGRTIAATEKILGSLPPDARLQLVPAGDGPV